MSFIDVEQIFAILFLVGVVCTAIVSTINPSRDTAIGKFLWKLVKILNFMSVRNPRGSQVLWEDDEQKCCGKCKCRDEKDN